ncbi:MAG: glycosyltransferase family 39 protein [Nitrospinota bacterium]|nr:glycosyltransferase family 39 protein [Nitrospinota bacterium]
MDRTKAHTLLFIAAVSLFRLAFAGWFELSLDEGYYWLWGQHPSMSYYDHPPMVAWIITATGLLGESERMIRLGAILCGAASSYFIYLTAREVFNEGKPAFWAVVLLNLTPMFTLGSLVMTPDSPLFTFWAMTVYYGARLVNTQQPHYWYALGFFFGLALLSKYTAALFAPALLVFLIVSEENRAWLFRKEPYLAFALSMIIFSPVILWNYQRDWISFRFQLSHGLAGENPGFLLTMGEFWGSQAAITGVFVFFFMIAAMVGVSIRGLRERRDDYLYLGVISLSLFGFFLLNSARTRMEGNWGVPMYFTIIATTPFMVAIYSERGAFLGRLTSMGYRFSLFFAAALLVYAHVQIVEPVLPMPKKYEISRRIFGWRALAAESDRRLAELGANAFILANRYQISTLLTYYTKGHRPAYISNGKGRFGYLGSVEKLPGAPALYVTETGRDDIATIGRHFQRVEKDGFIRIERQGELIREFTFYKCYNYQGEFIRL